MRINNYISAFLFIGAAMVVISCEQKKAPRHGEEATEVSPHPPKKTTIESPRKQAAGHIGDVKVVVDYGSPGVKRRKIWGKLEPYGKVWRAGANETTSIEFSKDVKINGTDVPAGKYGFYLIPNENEDWIAIFNTDWSREKHSAWGAYNYTPEHDVVRVKVTPEWAKKNQERLTYTVEDDGIHFAWAKARLTIPVEPAGD